MTMDEAQRWHRQAEQVAEVRQHRACEHRRPPVGDAAMTTITEFLLARIAEHEAAASPRMSEINAGQAIGPGAVVTNLPGWDDQGGSWGRGRVLAECEAKRRIVALHADDGKPAPPLPSGCTTCATGVFTTGEVDPEFWPCATIRALASVYADHQEFREEWRA